MAQHTWRAIHNIIVWLNLIIAASVSIGLVMGGAVPERAIHLLLMVYGLSCVQSLIQSYKLCGNG